MKLYHFTDKNNLKNIDIKYFGKNHFTNNDKNISNVKRAFFYDNKKPQEWLLNDAKYRYTIIIDNSKIYDLSKDKSNLIAKYNNIDKILRIIKKEYVGAKYNNGFECYILFKNQKAIAKKEL